MHPRSVGRSGRTIIALSAALLSAPALFVSHAIAVENGGRPALERPETVYTRGAQSSGPSKASALLAYAAKQGEIRVIAGLGLAMKRGALSAADAAAQAASLSGAQDRVALRALGSASSAGVVKFDTIPFVALKVGPDALSRLLADGEVVSVQVDVPEPPTLSESVPLINADDLVRRGIDGSGRVVAILDTGVASGHPMILGKIAAEACYSTTDSAYTATSVCPGGAAASTAPGSGKDCPADVDGCSHGTHVASTAAGNTAALKGVAPGGRIVPVQVFSKFTSGSYCGSVSPCVLSFTTDQIKGLERVLALRSSLAIDAANMSLGGGSYTTACDAQDPARKAVIDNLMAAGVATVISSGNSGSTGAVGAPGCISTAVTVGATTKTDRVASYSNHAPMVDLLAPGSAIRAAIPPTGYAIYSGTSMAAPHVTGAFALLRDSKPTASVADVLAALSCTGVPIALRETGATVQPKPRIDVLAAWQALQRTGGSKSWPFTKPADGNDWTPVIGTWKVAGGHYQGTADPVGWIASGTPNCGAAMTVEAKLGRELPKEKKTFANTGIMYKVQAGADGAISGYFAAYNACPADKVGNCTGAKTDKPGIALLYRFANVNFEAGTGIVNNLCQVKGKVKVNKINEIKIVTDGANQDYFLNNKKVCSVPDATYATGGVAVVAYSSQKKAKALKVDSIKIAAEAEGAKPDSGEEATPMAAAPAALPVTALQSVSTPDLSASR